MMFVVNALVIEKQQLSNSSILRKIFNLVDNNNLKFIIF